MVELVNHGMLEVVMLVKTHKVNTVLLNANGTILIAIKVAEPNAHDANGVHVLMM